jgi:hypothetical protein
MPSAPGYPQTYADRGVASSFSTVPQGAAQGAVPNTRTFAFRLANLAANSRTTRSFGPFVGPALIKRFEWDVNTGVANGAATIGLGIAPASVTEDDVAITNVKGWRALIERIDRDAFVTPSQHEGFMQGSEAPTHGWQRGDLNIIVNDTSFYLTVTIYTAAAGFRWVGDGTVIEGINPAALANFR